MRYVEDNHGSRFRDRDTTGTNAFDMSLGESLVTLEGLSSARACLRPFVWKRHCHCPACDVIL